MRNIKELVGFIVIIFISAVLTLCVNASTTDCYEYIMPMRYEDIEIGDNYIYYRSGGKWGRADKNGKILTGAVYESPEEASEPVTVTRKSSFTPFTADNGLYGYKNGSGEIVIEAKYDAVANTFENNAAIVQYKGKYGIINTSGEVLFGFTCDTLYKSPVNNYYAYTINEKTGFIDDKFRVLSEPFLRAVFVHMYDGYVVYQAAGNKYGLASYDGKILCGAIWDYMRDFHEGLAAVGVNEDFYGISARWGYIDKKGNTVIPAIYYCHNPDSLDFSEGLAGVCEGNDGYYIDKTGKIILELPDGTFPYTGFSGSMAVVTRNLEKKYINKSGTVVAEAAPGVKWYRAENFVGDIAVVSSYFDTFTEGYAGVIRYHGNTPSSWALAEVEEAKKTSLVPQDLQGQYTAPITRAEYCKLAITLIEAFTKKPIDRIVKTINKNAFTDTDDSFVLYAQALGIVEGRGSGIFDPKGRINRQEAAKILVNTFKSCAFLPGHTTTMPKYDDRDTIDAWAKEGIWYTGEWGVMIGVGNNMFAPKKDYTREQSVLTMIRLYKILLENRPQTMFISPEITVIDGAKTDGYAADPEFFIKITVPAGWKYDRKKGEFTAKTGEASAVLSDVMIFPGGVPDRTDGNGTYYYKSGEHIGLTLTFRSVPQEIIDRIRAGMVIYDRRVPSMTDDPEAYMYDVSRRAAEARGWFEVCTMMPRFGIGDIINRYANNETGGAGLVPPTAVTPDGYIEIGDPVIKTCADLEAYLRTLFSDEITAELMGTGRYRDIDGRLYGQDMARGIDITKGDASAEIIRAGDNKIIYKVTVELLDKDGKTVRDYETHEFIYENTGSKWVWTKFYLYR